MLFYDDDVTVSDTAGKIGDAVQDDLAQTKEHLDEAGDWVKDKAEDVGHAAENAAERVGVNEGNPNSNQD